MRVTEALEYLAETDEKYGRLKGSTAALEYIIKVAEAEGFIEADGPQGERQAKARSSEKYKKAVEDYRDVRTDMEIIGAKRKTAELTIEVWRSQNANRRQGNI